MFFDIIKNRIEQKNRTSKYPKKEIELPKNYRGLPKINTNCSIEIVEKCADVCPQDAINIENKTIDLRKCTFCGLCEKVSNGKFVTFTRNFEMASTKSEKLILNGEVENLKVSTNKSFKKMFGRSLQLRVVSAGGCNACEADINVLNTPFYDLSRFGIQFVASPRHADGLLITGPVTKNMEYALKKAYKDIPDPKIIIASGSCALSGGPFRNNIEQINGVENILKVDLFVPGCPPHPLTLLSAILDFFGIK
ncbi:hydrogenase [Tepiditoga spiralis]|uniref:Hydrogenase n=1 Tax=Tepiditoga spiralis TaxID=2108365 RepID=A0A7G1G952_9BACT|nr:hypothetical protein [Tepiditoga spiralis]BBE31507.1 hydrogenase [Tepiditoga spiralis]